MYLAIQWCKYITRIFHVHFIHDRTTFWQNISVINTIVIAVMSHAYMSQQYHYHTIAFLVIAIVHVLKLAIFNWYMTKIVVIHRLSVFSHNTIGLLLGNSWNFQVCLEKFVSKFPESFRFQWPQQSFKFSILHISSYQYQADCNYVLIWWVTLGSLISQEMKWQQLLSTDVHLSLIGFGKYPLIWWNISTYRHANVVIIVPADVLAPYGARKSFGTVLIRMLRHVFYEISSPISVWI